MAYITGTANTLADLLAAIQNACTANGWALSGSVLHKGTCYVEVVIGVWRSGLGNTILARGGTGIDGSNNLTGACNTSRGALGADEETSGGNQAWAWPATYNIHILTDPDEVYVVCNYATTFYQTLAFGQSNMPGLVGSGNWYCGVGIGKSNVTVDSYDISSLGEGIHNVACYAGFSLFCRISTWNPYGVDHEMDSATWKVDGAARDWAAVAFRAPNQWNQEAILQPIRVYVARPSGFFSPVLECAHARFVTLSSLNDGQIITIGADKWKVYPWWSRGAAYDVNEGGTIKWTGQFGHAIRYDGP